MTALANGIKILKTGVKIQCQSPNVQKKNLQNIISRCKMHAAILDDEKVSESDVVQCETTNFLWLHRVSPAFPVHGSNVTVIYEPSEFYATLLHKSKTAKERISLASLYIGTGNLEINLVKSIKNSLEINRGNLEVTILLDYMRGSRGKVNSKQILKPLLEGEYGYCCNVFLYHTPKLQGLLKTLIPDRFNELIGLQHMKLYIFDNTLIISGANLSNDYFTNRQDRYLMIENCQELCDFYCDLIKKVAEFSFRLKKDMSVVYSDQMEHHPFKSQSDKFAEEASEKIHYLFQSEMNNQPEGLDIKNADTWIFPLIQMGQLNIRHDSEVTLRLLETAPSNAILRLATGYFNLTSTYKDAIINMCQAQCHFLTAHPKANGFYGAKGIAGGIPAAYTKIEESFLKLCDSKGQNQRIHLWEFVRAGWTYHAKGLWYSLSESEKPSLTLIGSPNFGYRSVERDLETQIVLTTSNSKLQESLQVEYERLFDRASIVSKKTFKNQERIPPAWVRLAVFFFRYYF